MLVENNLGFIHLCVQIIFSLGVALNGAIIVLGLFGASCLFFKNRNRYPNRILSALLVVISLWLIDTFLRISGLYGQNPRLYFKPIYYSFAFGPLIYFYVRSIVNSEFKFAKIHLLHFIPVAIQAALYFFLSLQEYNYRHWYWQEVHLPWTYRIEFDGTFVSMAIYLFLSLRLLGGYRKWLTNSYSNLSTINLNWLRVILILMLLLCGQWFVEAILRDVYENYYQYNYSVIILGVLALVLAYKAFYQEGQEQIVYPKKEMAEPNQVETIDPELLNIIQSRMKTHQDYLDPILSLRVFASNCQMPSRTVSRYINQHLGQSFHQFVNDYRVQEFKRRAILKEERGMTLEGIAYDCGFNSKATFNRIFKASTGLTPSQYVSKHA